jgi:hypothetical protein
MSIKVEIEKEKEIVVKIEMERLIKVLITCEGP